LPFWVKIYVRLVLILRRQNVKYAFNFAFKAPNLRCKEKEFVAKAPNFTFWAAILLFVEP